MKTGKSKIIRNIVASGVIVILILVTSLYITGNLTVQNRSNVSTGGQERTSSSPASFILDNSVTYSTQQARPPAGANVQQIASDAYWPSVYGVKNNSQFLLFGTVYGIWNTTARDVGANVIGVFTFFVFHVNQSLVGDIPSGKLIMVMQQGGLSFPSETSNQYLNETFDNYPLLEVHGSYVLALSAVFPTALVLYGPYSIYPVRGGMVYSSAPASGLNDVGLARFLSNWNAIGNTSSSNCCPVVTTSTES